MIKVLKLKPIVNKANGQINLSLKNGHITPALRKQILSKEIKTLKFKLEGFE